MGLEEEENENWLREEEFGYSGLLLVLYDVMVDVVVGMYGIFYIIIR